MLDRGQGNPFPVPIPVDSRVTAAHAAIPGLLRLELEVAVEVADGFRIRDYEQGLLSFHGMATVEAAVPNHDAVRLGDPPVKRTVVIPIVRKARGGPTAGTQRGDEQ